MTSRLEAKAVVPAIGTLSLDVLAVAVYRVLESFGLVRLSAEQEAAVAGLLLALTPLLGFALAYLAPHTERPDLAGRL